MSFSNGGAMGQQELIKAIKERDDDFLLTYLEDDTKVQDILFVTTLPNNKEPSVNILAKAVAMRELSGDDIYYFCSLQKAAGSPTFMKRVVWRKVDSKANQDLLALFEYLLKTNHLTVNQVLDLLKLQFYAFNVASCQASKTIIALIKFFQMLLDKKSITSKDFLVFLKSQIVSDGRTFLHAFGMRSVSTSLYDTFFNSIWPGNELDNNTEIHFALLNLFENLLNDSLIQVEELLDFIRLEYNKKSFIHLIVRGNQGAPTASKAIGNKWCAWLNKLCCKTTDITILEYYANEVKISGAHFKLYQLYKDINPDKARECLKKAVICEPPLLEAVKVYVTNLPPGNHSDSIVDKMQESLSIKKSTAPLEIIKRVIDMNAEDDVKDIPLLKNLIEQAQSENKISTAEAMICLRELIKKFSEFKIELNDVHILRQELEDAKEGTVVLSEKKCQ